MIWRWTLQLRPMPALRARRHPRSLRMSMQEWAAAPAGRRLRSSSLPPQRKQRLLLLLGAHSPRHKCPIDGVM